MKRVWAMVVLVCLLVCGCGTAEDIPTKAVGGDIVGVYEQKLDMAVWLIENYPDEQVMYYFPEKPDPCYLYLTVTFGKEGTYTSVLNQEKSAEGLRGFVVEWLEATRKYYADLIEYNKMNTTVEEMLADYRDYKGESMEETFLKQLDTEKMTEVFSTEGRYRVDGERLYRGDKDTVYETYTVTEEALYILSSNDPELSEDDKAGYPYKFERVK